MKSYSYEWYLHDFKKYDIDLLCNFKVFEKSKIPSNITPEKNICIDCQTHFSNPVKVCDNVRVFTMRGIVTGFKSYAKKMQYLWIILSIPRLEVWYT